MTFKEIYDRIIPLWGELIDISDASDVKPENAVDTPGTTPSNDNYFHSNSLSKLWDKIEETVGHEDTFGDQMVWTMYQVFHRHASRLFSNGIFVFDPRTIDKREIEEQYFGNLNTESWEDELANYERTIE